MYKPNCILQLPKSYCVSLVVVAIARHIVTNIFQMGRFSAVKFAMGYEKNMSFLVIPKSPEVWKKVEQIGLGFFEECMERLWTSNVSISNGNTEDF